MDAGPFMITAEYVRGKVHVNIVGCTKLTLVKHQIALHLEAAEACGCGRTDCLPCVVAGAVKAKGRKI